MKKRRVLILSLLLLVAMLFSLSAPAFATEIAFSTDFFPNGKNQTPEASFEKNSNSIEPIMPENIEAPVISDFNFVLENQNMARATLFVNMPDSVADAERYQIIVKDDYKPYYIDTQIKINDGDWFSCNDNNKTALCSGIKSFDVFNAMNISDDA